MAKQHFVKAAKTAINVLDYIEDYNKLLSWHLGVFGLIDKGHAIDINSISK